MDDEVRRAPADAERPERGETAEAGLQPRIAAYARVPAVLVAAAIALAIILGVVLWLVLRGGSEAESSRRAPATAASIQRLNAFASSVGHPIYWAGAQPKFTYELSRTKDGRVYIRYLPPGVKIGNRKPNYLTVATYPQPHALATLRAAAKKQGVQTIHLAGGGLAFQYKGRPTSVYVAYPGLDYQIEVFDPSPARAVQLVASGQIKPVGAPPRTPAGSKPASIQQLKALAVTLGHPIYWAGARPGNTYELTRTKGGNVYIRYLPSGVAVGDPSPDYLAIGTYPQKGALKILKATATRNNVPTLKLDNGGLGFVDKKHPTSVYVAYPNVDVQVEVYDRAPGRARQLVASGQIAAVR
jgi:hypothetical protein